MESFRIHSLGAIDYHELRNLIGDDATPDSTEEEDGRHGDTATFALILLATAPTLRALASWILAQRRRHREVNLHIERKLPDGSHENLELSVKLRQSDVDHKVILEQLAKLLDVDETTIRQILQDESS